MTGGSGYIGSAIISQLQKYECKIIRISRSKLPPMRGVEDKVLDLLCRDSWIKIVSKSDVIFHLAGNTSIAVAEENIEESLLINLIPITHLIYASETLNKRSRVIYASTATIYGMTKLLPVSECTKPEPTSVYDLHKLFAEQQLSMASSNNVINATSLRLSNVYGPSLSDSSANDRGILNKITKMALNGEDINIYGDGNNIRDYIHIDDVVSAFLHSSILEDFQGRSLNVSTQVGFTVK